MFEMVQCQKLKTSKKINRYLETFKNTKFVHIHAYKTSDTYNTTSPCMSPHYVTVSLYFVPGIPTISESVVVPSHCGSPPWRCSVLRCVWSPPWAWTAVVGLGAPLGLQEPLRSPRCGFPVVWVPVVSRGLLQLGEPGPCCLLCLYGVSASSPGLLFCVLVLRPALGWYASCVFMCYFDGLWFLLFCVVLCVL